MQSTMLIKCADGAVELDKFRAIEYFGLVANVVADLATNEAEIAEITVSELLYAFEYCEAVSSGHVAEVASTAFTNREHFVSDFLLCAFREDVKYQNVLECIAKDGTVGLMKRVIGATPRFGRYQWTTAVPVIAIKDEELVRFVITAGCPFDHEALIAAARANCMEVFRFLCSNIADRSGAEDGILRLVFDSLKSAPNEYLDIVTDIIGHRYDYRPEIEDILVLDDKAGVATTDSQNEDDKLWAAKFESTETDVLDDSPDLTKDEIYNRRLDSRKPHQYSCFSNSRCGEWSNPSRGPLRYMS